MFSDRMGFSKMRNLLTAVGCPVESQDMDFCFHTLDITQNGYISREDFSYLLELSPDEQDEAIVFAHNSIYETIKGTSKLKHSQLFVEMFKMINANGDDRKARRFTLAERRLDTTNPNRSSGRRRERGR